MMSGLNFSDEMNEDIIIDAGDIITRSLVVEIVVEFTVQSIVTVTSVSTVSGSVTVQVIVSNVPSYSILLGILSVDIGVGTVMIYR